MYFEVSVQLEVILIGCVTVLGRRRRRD